MSILHSFRNKETGNKTDLWVFNDNNIQDDTDNIFNAFRFEVEFHNHESSYFNVSEELDQEEFHEMLKKMMDSDKWEIVE